MDAQWLEAVATALSALAAMGSIWAVLHVWNGQKALAKRTDELQTSISTEQRELQKSIEDQQEVLQRELASKQESLQKELAGKAATLQRELADKDALSSRRAALVGLWPYMSDIHQVDPEKSAAEEVRRAVNILELVALCWEAKIIDRQIITRTFESTYINIYEQVTAVVRKLEGINKTGRELLNENPSAVDLYNTLKNEQVRRTRIV